MIHYQPAFLNKTVADNLFQTLLASEGWKQDEITLYGKTIPVPRLHQWFGDASYTYSGIEMAPSPLPEPLRYVQAALRRSSAHLSDYNSCLANLYRDGKDSVAWHSDDEPELGPEPVIASVSLGATRRFLVRDKATKALTAYTLEHGSLLIMSGKCQELTQHSLPKTAKPVGPRINLTFRSLK